MERKKLTPNSFQQRVVDFLKENFPNKFTAREILEEMNRKAGESRSDGSMSGTLTALKGSGWVIQSDEYPSRYYYRDINYIESRVVEVEQLVKHSNTGKDSLNDILENKIDDIKREITEIDKQLEVLKRRKLTLQANLEFAEDLLLQQKRLVSG